MLTFMNSKLTKMAGKDKQTHRACYGTFWTCFFTSPFSRVFIFSGLIHYIYCSTLASTIIQHVQGILLYTLIVVTIVIIIVPIILFTYFI